MEFCKTPAARAIIIRSHGEFHSVIVPFTKEKRKEKHETGKHHRYEFNPEKEKLLREKLSVITSNGDIDQCL